MPYPDKTRPLAFTSVTAGSSTAVAVSSITAVSAAERALIRVTGATANWRDDGTAPTATTGFPMNVGEVMDYTNDPSALQFISTGTTVTIYIAAYTE